MKLKKHFLSLSALLGVSLLATSAWAESCNGHTSFVDETRALESDNQGGYFINMSSPSTSSCHSIRTTVTIPEGVKTFKVYDDGGADGAFTSFACGGWYCSTNLVIIAPEGYNIRVTGSLKTRANNVGSTAGDLGSLVIHDRATTVQLAQYQGAESNVLTWIDNQANIRFYAADYAGINQDGLDLTVHLLKKNETKSTTAIDIYDHGDASAYNVAKISNVQSGTVSIPSPIAVNAIEYDRVFIANTPATIVLPFSLPAGATTNAKFYTLKSVVQVEGEYAWTATFRNIKLDSTNALPEANKPYAVIVPDATELQFNLNGGKATFQTAEIDTLNDDTGNWIFLGTYKDKVWETGDDELGLAYAIAKKSSTNYKAGDFVKVGAGASAAPMRAYISKVNASVTLRPLSRPLARGEVSSIENLPEVINVEFVDEDEKTTAFGRMNTVTGEFKMLRDFDLKGRKVNSANRARGAYYGKKVLKK